MKECDLASFDATNEFRMKCCRDKGEKPISEASVEKTEFWPETLKVRPYQFLGEGIGFC